MVVYFSAFIILLLTIVLYLYLNQNSDYWKKRNVPFIPSVPILGNLKKLIFLEKSPGPFLGYLYNAAEAVGQKFVGIFLFNNEPALLVRDPELIKNILVKDFQHFANRNVQCHEEWDPLGANNLFVVRDQKWKLLRKKLSPTFMSAKLKLMFGLIKEVADDLLRHLDNIIEKESDKCSVVFETRNVIARYTTDVISTCAFGIKSNALLGENSQFKGFGSKIFHLSIKRSLELRAFFFMHWLVKMLKGVLLQKESTNFLRKVFLTVLEEREKNNIVRNDFLDLLIKLKREQKEKAENKTKEAEEDLFEFEDFLLAQSVVFFTAGFETTASVISLALYELAVHPDIQDKLREEIQAHLKTTNGEVTYEGIFQMKFLDMVVLETLRKYPPMPFIDRVCTMDYKIPDTDLIIRTGTPVFVSLYHGIHYDTKYFPMPENFDPERFNEENKKNTPPCAFMPFGEGPHICIGMRFALMNIRTALTFILPQYKVEICEKTKIPLEIDPRPLLLSPKHGSHLRFVKLNKS